MTIGILPCAGRAERFNGLPKYLLPCPEGYLLERHVRQMKAVAGVRIGCSDETEAILKPKFWEEVFWAENVETMTQTVLSMRYGDNDNIVFGMPDSFLHTEGNLYEAMNSILENSDTDLLVGCFHPRPNQWQQGGMVVFEQGDCIQAVIDKPEEYPPHSYIWGVMAWRPRFWECLEPDMPHVGYGIMKAVEKGLKVNAVLFKGDFYDCGSPTRYFECIRNVTDGTE